MNATEHALQQAIIEQHKARPGVCFKSAPNPPTDIDSRQRTVTAWVSVQTLDRDGEVVVSDGLNLDEYRRNPVVLAQHDQPSLVAKSQWIKVARSPTGVPGIIAKAHFGRTELACETFSLIEDEILRGVSIGMDIGTMKRREPSTTELKAFEGVGAIIESAVLLEYSFVSIPANADALIIGFEQKRFKASLPLFEPLIKAVVDAGSRRRAYIRVVESAADLEPVAYRMTATEQKTWKRYIGYPVDLDGEWSNDAAERMQQIEDLKGGILR